MENSLKVANNEKDAIQVTYNRKQLRMEYFSWSTSIFKARRHAKGSLEEMTIMEGSPCKIYVTWSINNVNPYIFPVTAN